MKFTLNVEVTDWKGTMPVFHRLVVKDIAEALIAELRKQQNNYRIAITARADLPEGIKEDA